MAMIVGIDWGRVGARVQRLERAWGTPAGPPPLAEAEVADAERELGIVFPEDYRQYLLRVSAGGTGPSRIRPLSRRGADGWGWEGDLHTDVGALASAFPARSTYEAEWGALDAEEPVPGRFRDGSAFDKASRAWDARCEELHEVQTRGAVFLGDDGCGFVLLIVSGPERGAVWYDRRATSDAIVPLLGADGTHASFGDLYMEWLDRAERAVETARRDGTEPRVRRVVTPIFETRFGNRGHRA
ncbi:SMI1/KNR4 family protein [Streptomyces sp. NPDC051567]|uniref:SMI1/KNR4 family protein n=1 Tax=Streptomyces sp. NPDC051567 TaxID=3365660 RepID=UPI0037998A0B